MQVCWPVEKGSSSAEPRYYSEQDLAVGAILTIHQRQFELLNADEFTYQVGLCHRLCCCAGLHLLSCRISY